jgi:hypothetical protein
VWTLATCSWSTLICLVASNESMSTIMSTSHPDPPCGDP